MTEQLDIVLLVEDSNDSSGFSFSLLVDGAPSDGTPFSNNVVNCVSSQDIDCIIEVNTSDNEDKGSYVLTLTLTDTHGEFDSIDIKVEILGLNSEPVILEAISDLTLKVETEKDLGFEWSDEDPDDEFTVTFAVDGVEGALPGFMLYDPQIDANLITVRDSSNADAGSYLIQVTVTDNDSAGSGETLSASFTFTVTFTPYNHSPVLENEQEDILVFVYEDLRLVLPFYTDEDELTDTFTETIEVISAPTTDTTFMLF